MGFLELLVFYEHASVFLKDLWETGKEWMREYLGPSITTTYLLENDTVIPATLRHGKHPYTATYNPLTKRIADSTENSYRRLPWLTVQHILGDHIVDISDWMTELRSNTHVSLMAVIRLASYTHSIHLPETDSAIVRVITRDGEEKEYKYVGNVKLVQFEPEVHRRQTCPFDMEGMPMF